MVRWTYYYPWVTPDVVSIPLVSTYSYSAPTYAYPVPTYPYTVSTYPYAVYYPRSRAGERWWDYKPNWAKTVEYARTQSSIRVFRGGAWVTP